MNKKIYSIASLIVAILIVIILNPVGLEIWKRNDGISNATKPLPPLDVELVIPAIPPRVGDTILVELDIESKVEIKRAFVKFETEGIVNLINEKSRELENMNKDSEKNIPIQIKITKNGKGTLKVNVFSLDPQGNIIFGRASSLYFLADNSKVLIGKSGFVNLEIEKLKKKYGGQILIPGTPTYEQYQKERNEILGGGATETNEPADRK